MAAELQEEQLAEAAQEPAAEPEQQQVEQPVEPQPTEPEAPQEPKKKRELLLPFLTILLVVLGISEAAFWGYFGFSSYRNSLAVQRYEEEQRALEQERAANGIQGGSAYGPNLKVENGTVTWQREDWVSAGNALSSGTPTPPPVEEPRTSGLYVPGIPYTLADSGKDSGQTSKDSATT